MRYGFLIPGGDVRGFGDLAAAAEEAGWDGVFLADAMDVGSGKPYPWFDPFVALAAMAVRTSRVRLGTFITPLSRRRPWKVARETITLDQLSNGRLILGVGLGAAEDDGGFYKVGEATDIKVRAELLDEGLEILTGLWMGKTVNFKGEHYRVEKMTMLPRPVQKPRIPVWVVGIWQKEKSMSRALKYEGLIPQNHKSPASLRPADIRAIHKYVEEHRSAPKPLEIVVGGETSGLSRARTVSKVRPLLEAGATWWLENVWSGDQAKVLKRIKQGPPTTD